MSTRTITIEPYSLPGASETVYTEVVFQLVDAVGNPIDGYRQDDNTGILGKLVLQIEDVAVAVDLTPNDEIRPDSYWRCRVYVDCKRISEALVQMPAGGPLTLPEFLELDTSTLPPGANYVISTATVSTDGNMAVFDGVDGRTIRDGGPPGTGGGGGHVIQDDGTPLPQRTALNFIDLAVADNPGNNSTDVTGQPGPQGPQGDPGPAGADGADGADGRTWLSGSGAPSDVLGADGDFYLDLDVDSYYGPKNLGTWIGTGPTSLVGPQGATGAAGSDGKTWHNGATTPPSDVLGVDGDFYLDTTLSQYWGPKAGGTWTGTGPTDLIGADGADGADGKTWHSGSGAPSGGIGVDGDFYLDTTNDEYYGPKTGGAWGTGTSLIGPQGPPGADGQDGQDGTSITIAGTDTWTNIQAIPSPTVGETWILSQDDPTAPPPPGGGTATAGDGLTWDGAAWVNVGPLRGPQGEQGPEGPTAVSTDANNLATLGSDSLLYVPTMDTIEGVAGFNTPPGGGPNTIVATIATARCTRAELEAARLVNQLIAGRMYYITDENAYVLGTGINTTVEYLPDNTTAVDIGAEPTIAPKNSAFNKDFGTGAGEVCEGNDARLSEALNRVLKAGDIMTGDLDLTSSDVNANDGQFLSQHTPFPYVMSPTDSGGFRVESLADPTKRACYGIGLNPVSGTEEVNIGAACEGLGVRLRGSYAIIDTEALGLRLEGAAVGSTMVVTGLSQNGEAIIGALQPPGIVYEESNTDASNRDLGTGAGTGPWFDIVTLPALTQDCAASRTQIIYQMFAGNFSATEQCSVEVGYKIDGVDPTDWRLHDLGIDSSGIPVSDVFQPPTDLLTGEVLTLAARRVGAGATSNPIVQGSTVAASQFTVRLLELAGTTGETNVGLALATPNAYRGKNGVNLEFRGFANTTDITWAIDGGNIALEASLAATGVTPGSYTTADITVDANGRITAAANGSGGTVDLAVGNRTSTALDITNTGGTDATVPEASATLAGLLSAANFNLLGSALQAVNLNVAPTATTVVITNSGGDNATLNAASGAGDSNVAGILLPGEKDLIGSAMQAVIDDTDPYVGGDLKIGGINNYVAIFTDVLNTEIGSVGYVDATYTGIYLAYAPQTTFDESDGAILCSSGEVDLFGAAVSLKGLAHTNPLGKQLYISENSIIYTVDPPPVTWSDEQDDASDYSLGTGTGTGAWVELTGTQTEIQADVAAGDPLAIQALVFAVNVTSNRSGVIEIGFGVDHVAPVNGVSYSITGGFYGYLPIASFQNTTHGGLTTGQHITIYARRVSGSHVSFGVDLLGTAEAHNLTISAAAAGGGGGSPTNISIDQSGVNNIVVESSTGTNGTIVPATQSTAGGLSAADKTKVDSAVISSDATVTNVVVLTQTEYDALSPPDSTTQYLIRDAGCTP